MRRAPLLLLALSGLPACEVLLGIESREERVCRGGTARCDELGSRLVCDPDGAAETPEPCPAPLACGGEGTCVVACVPGAARCDELGRRLVCTGDGDAELEEPCLTGAECSGAGACVCPHEPDLLTTCSPCASGASDTSVKLLARGAAANHTCALVCDGRVACWGDNKMGQVGVASGGANVTSPVWVPLPAPARQVVVGFEHTCALLDDATAWCWGDNRRGQVDGAREESSLPFPVAVAGLTPARFLAAGWDSTCAIMASGELRCVGSNTHGQLGSESAGGESRTPLVVAPAAGVTGSARRVSMGTQHACALYGDGELACWGNGGLSGVGLMSTAAIPPTHVPIDAVTEVSVGDLHTCVIAGGEVWCFGGNSHGQCGVSTTDQPSPQLVRGLSGATGVGAGFRSSCAAGPAGLWCWGSNGLGQLGDSGCSMQSGCGSLYQASPRKIAAIGQEALGVFWTHACASGGDVLRCWGHNVADQTGTGEPLTILGVPTPTLWPPVDGWAADSP